MGRVLFALFGVMVLGVVTVAWPSMNESTREPCRALEKLTIARALDAPVDPDQPYRDSMRRTIANTLIRDSQLDGGAGTRAAHRRLRPIPTYVGCALGYWQVSLVPASLDGWLAGMWY
ncbi:hypothetical protein [Falsiroseomonas sp. HW251]|uniref:hypothetical protein n=1 Tax=Falsiroseomonas sp. HW251 TaxID=3390998 RepID=UPI003D319703